MLAESHLRFAEAESTYADILKADPTNVVCRKSIWKQVLTFIDFCCKFMPQSCPSDVKWFIFSTSLIPTMFFFMYVDDLCVFWPDPIKTLCCRLLWNAVFVWAKLVVMLVVVCLYYHVIWNWILMMNQLGLNYYIYTFFRTTINKLLSVQKNWSCWCQKITSIIKSMQRYVINLESTNTSVANSLENAVKDTQRQIHIAHEAAVR